MSKKTLSKQREHTSFVRNIVIGLTMVMIGIAIVFSIDSFLLHTKTIRRNVVLAGQDISGFSYPEFSRFIEKYKQDILSKKIFLNVGEAEIIVFPQNIGLSFDTEHLWEKAYHVGREKNILERFLHWSSFPQINSEVPLESFVNKDRYLHFAQTWVHDARLKKVFEGNVSLKGSQVIVKLPEGGKGIDFEQTLDLLIDAFLHKKTDAHIDAPIVDIPYRRDVNDLYDFAQRVRYAIDAPLELRNDAFDDVYIKLSPEDIMDILNVIVPPDPKADPYLDIDDARFAQKLILLKVKDADFVVNKDYSVKVIPGRMGVEVNLFETKNNLLRELSKENPGIVHISIHDIHTQDFSERDADELGVKHVVSEFTTHHPCCGARVENIHHIADMLDGVIIRSGERFNVNTFIGERTKEKGFKEAGSIFEGKMTTSIGGGISQFITTLHNAVYWGGYKIIEHKPHSIYFSRYPHGIEATIDWPNVHYIFQNDTDAAIVLDTEYTDTSITVRILGDNDGRIISGDHRKWVTPMKVLKKGGAHARHVISHVDDARNFVSPLVSYLSDSKIPRGAQTLYRVGKKGWHTLVRREVFIGENRYSFDVWPILYRSGKKTLYKVHPCDNPEEKEKPKNC